jgi:1L-myo-inositol 1-phosphate cytidylyltransferase / CDP-L-myo-inositol myo-inositolphosphotransferase
MPRLAPAKAIRYPITGEMIDECLIITENAGALTELCGISVLDRLLRTLQRCGFQSATVWATEPDAIRTALARPSQFQNQIAIKVRGRESGPLSLKEIVDLSAGTGELFMVVKGDMIFDDRLLRLLATQTTATALIDSAPPESLQQLIAVPQIDGGWFCGAAVLNKKWAAAQDSLVEESIHKGLAEGAITVVDVAAQPTYSPEMRRPLRPFWFPAPPPSEKLLAEQLILRSAQKGAQDLPAWVHAPIENFLISCLWRTSITPNQLTISCNVIAWTATVLFTTGHLACGLALALLVGVLDGLDGKQARVKIETTSGGKLEHWFDAAFEWSWWIALAYHLQISGKLPAAFWYLFLLLLAEAVDGIAKGTVLFKTGKLIDELSLFERVVRLFGGRRNVYVWILTIGLLFGAPAKAFIVMAWWEVATAILHLPRAAWVLLGRERS